MSFGSQSPEVFVTYWLQAQASERANAQLFLAELADLLGVPRPTNSHAEGYSFEYPVRIPTGPTTYSDGRIDLYRRGCFVLEAKQFVAPLAEQTDLELAAAASGAVEPKKKSGPIRGSGAWDDAMIRARGQAERYARALPAEEPAPPFLLVVDVGHTFEIYADFTQAGKSYLPFPDPRTFRLRLEDLRDEKMRERPRRIWLDPLSLDPAKVSAEVTREIAGYLAVLATSLEKAGHAPRLVAEFLTRCLFCMFAEDVGLLPKDSFRGLLESPRQSPEGFVPKLRTLFGEMQTGTAFSVILNKKLLRFNGGLFEDASVLPVDGAQLGILIRAAAAQWKNVEPAIFGTLLERALDPAERHQLGAHYTPRAYVERLVLPTIIEPLRAEWDAVRAAALVYAVKDDMAKARAEILGFHSRLCEVKVLDPACGSGNFLYVALEHLKRLEGEVLDAATGFGENLLLDIATHSVDPHQFLGIELNPRAAAVAEMVLWIGYLQWHFRTRGDSLPAEPVLKKFRNIECRDAVLAWDGDSLPMRDERGEIITVWDRRSMKTDFVTGNNVPDEAKRLPLLTYPNARPAVWPKADYIIGNPPFLGSKRMREGLGDGYVDSIQRVWPAIPQATDFVMRWWHHAAILTSSCQVVRFGFITTNSFGQVYVKRAVEPHLSGDNPISIVFAIPDHPWVDSEDGASVRIAMTVAELGRHPGKLRLLLRENSAGENAAHVEFDEAVGPISASLQIGAGLQSAEVLESNRDLCAVGMKTIGEAFQIGREEAVALGLGNTPGLAAHLRPYLNGKDLLHSSRGIYIVDFFGVSEMDVRSRYPAAYQYLLTHARPERLQNRNEQFVRTWWIIGHPRQIFRRFTAGIRRYIATVETSKHRIFAFLPSNVTPDSTIVTIGLEDAFHFGVLCSRIHVVFSLAAGGRLGVGNDPRYNKTRCFDPFPFPVCDDTAKARIRALGEELDAHRKRVQAQHPGLSLTAMYNVLEALRAGRALTPKEQGTHEAGLVSLLRQLHDELDDAVAAAYGWPVDLPDAEILVRLVALNAERAAEETSGLIRWLRPEYQNPAGTSAQTGLSLADKDAAPAKLKPSKAREAWPKPLAERVQAVERALQAATMPVTAVALAKRFQRAAPAELAEILETLATLGRAHRDGELYTS